MPTIKTQANKLMHNIAHVLRGTAIALRIHRAHDSDSFTVYATLYGNNVREQGAPLCTIEDLTIDNIPYILAQISEATGRRIHFYIYVTVKPHKRAIYFIEVPYCSGLRRIGADIATALHESAIRDDNLNVVYSRRTDEISFREYNEIWQYATIED